MVMGLTKVSDLPNIGNNEEDEDLGAEDDLDVFDMTEDSGTAKAIDRTSRLWVSERCSLARSLLSIPAAI